MAGSSTRAAGAAFPVTAFLAVALGLAPAALLAVIAAVIDNGMAAGVLLANDWQTGRTTAGHVDCTPGGGTTRAQHEAGSHVLVSVPVINPAL